MKDQSSYGGKLVCKVWLVHNSTKDMYIINNKCQTCVRVEVNIILETSRLGKSEQR